MVVDIAIAISVPDIGALALSEDYLRFDRAIHRNHTARDVVPIVPKNGLRLLVTKHAALPQLGYGRLA
jgi:hypothetical protein